MSKRSGPTKREVRQDEETQVKAMLSRRAAEIQASDLNRRNRIVTLATSRETLFAEQFNAAAEKILKNKIVVKPYRPAKKKITERFHNIVLSDLHFHSMLDGREVPVPYGAHEEARRLAKVVVETADMKRQYRDGTVLNVHLMGDIIQNQLYDARDGAPLADQVAASMKLLIQAIAFWSSEFKHVNVRCTPGNHGRNTARHPDRAVLQKWDAIETHIYYAIKLATAHIPNISVEIPYTPYYTWVSFDKKGFATHGDTVFNPGNPGKALDMSNIQRQVYAINSKLVGVDRHALFVVGHVHFGSSSFLPDGTAFLSNGSLIPTDSYGQSIGLMTQCCGQWWFESVPGCILGDHRFLQVDETTDKNADLEKVIKPYLGLND